MSWYRRLRALALLPSQRTVTRHHVALEQLLIQHPLCPPQTLQHSFLLAYMLYCWQVRAIVGPHGGAMMNVQFASK